MDYCDRSLRDAEQLSISNRWVLFGDVGEWLMKEVVLRRVPKIRIVEVLMVLIGFLNLNHSQNSRREKNDNPARASITRESFYS